MFTPSLVIRTRDPWATSLTWETVSFIKYSCAKLWLYCNVDSKSKKHHLLLETLVTNLFENGPVVLEKKIFIFFTYFHYFVPSLVEIGPVVLKKTYFFNFLNVFTLYRKYLPLGKDMALHLKKLKSPLPEDALICAKFGWNWVSGSGKLTCEHFTDIWTSDGGTTDNRRSEKHFSLRLRLAKKNHYL